jgi:hypothetical protein
MELPEGRAEPVQHRICDADAELKTVAINNGRLVLLCSFIHRKYGELPLLRGPSPSEGTVFSGWQNILLIHIDQSNNVIFFTEIQQQKVLLFPLFVRPVTQSTNSFSRLFFITNTIFRAFLKDVMGGWVGQFVRLNPT